MGTLSPEAEGIEELVVDRLDDLTDGGYPPPQTLGPGHFGVALGRMDDLGSVALQPAPVVLYSASTRKKSQGLGRRPNRCGVLAGQMAKVEPRETVWKFRLAPMLALP